MVRRQARSGPSPLHGSRAAAQTRQVTSDQTAHWTQSAEPLDQLASTGPSSFDVLPPSRCVELLGVATVGRVAFVGVAGLQVRPVNYRFIDGLVLLRVEKRGTLAELSTEHEVVFEVDYLASLTREGWSVLVRATSGALTDPEVLASPRLRTLVPWQCDGPSGLVALTPTQLTGRHVVPPGRQRAAH